MNDIPNNHPMDCTRRSGPAKHVNCAGGAEDRRNAPTKPAEDSAGGDDTSEKCPTETSTGLDCHRLPRTVTDDLPC